MFFVFSQNNSALQGLTIQEWLYDYKPLHDPMVTKFYGAIKL